MVAETKWEGIAGKQVVMTGATSGIGLAAAKALANMGARLAIVARDQARGAAAARAIDEAARAIGERGTASPDAPGPGGETAATSASQSMGTDVLIADLSTQAEVRRLAEGICERFPRVHVLVNNAGAVFVRRVINADGLEMTWALNHVGPWLLTNLLLEKLQASAPARVITTGSEAGVRSHIPFDDLDAARSWGNSRSMVRGFRRYGETKLANLVFTRELALRLEGTGVEAFCFHPGLVATGFNKNNGSLASLGMAAVRPFARTPEKGAETLVWLASSPEVNGQSGGYFFDCKAHRLPPGAEAPDVGRRLWEVTAAQTGG